MDELALLSEQAELLRAALETRLHEAETAVLWLRSLTEQVFLDEAHDRSVAAWLEREGFAPDPATGLYERAGHLRTWRAGGVVDAEHVYVWPARLAGDGDLRRRFYQLRRIGPVLSQVRARVHGAVWVYYQDAANAAVVHPAHEPGTSLTADFDWTRYEAFVAAAPASNPADGVRWCRPHVDYGGRGIIACVSAPVLVDGSFVGVWSLDLGLEGLYSDLFLHHLGHDLPDRAASAFLADRRGLLLVAPVRDPLPPSAAPGEFVARSVRDIGGDFASLDVEELSLRGAGALDLRDRDNVRLAVAFAVVPRADWVVFMTYPSAEMMAQVQRLFTRAFEKLAAGDFQFRVEPRESESLRAVALSYNRMVDALERAARLRDRAELRLRFLSRVSAELSRSLDVAAILDRTARHVVESVADWCAVELYERGSLVLSAEHHAADLQPPQMSVTECTARGAAASEVLRTGVPHTRSWEPVGPRMSVASVPIRSHGAVEGVIHIGSSGAALGSEDVALAGELASRVGVALYNARLRADLEDAVRLRDEFLMVASHELRTPLTPLTLNAQALLARMKSHDGERSTAEAIVRQVRRLSVTVDHLVVASTVNARGWRVQRKSLDLGALVRSVVGSFDEQASRAGCELSVRVPQSSWGLWDRSAMTIVVGNILDNAIKFGAGGSIEVVLTATSNSVRLTVRDHGIGIADHVLPQVLERFRRGVSARHYGGFGLGLHVVHTVVESLGGRVRVDNVDGGGVCVTVDLPVVTTHTAASTR